MMNTVREFAAEDAHIIFGAVLRREHGRGLRDRRRPPASARRRQAPELRSDQLRRCCNSHRHRCAPATATRPSNYNQLDTFRRLSRKGPQRRSKPGEQRRRIVTTFRPSCANRPTEPRVLIRRAGAKPVCRRSVGGGGVKMCRFPKPHFSEKVSCSSSARRPLIRATGVGLHSGERSPWCCVRRRPNTGIVFRASISIRRWICRLRR